MHYNPFEIYGIQEYKSVDLERRNQFYSHRQQIYQRYFKWFELSWTESKLFRIEFTFNCPKNKFLGCCDLIFFKKGKEIFLSLSWLSLLLSKVSSNKFLVVSLEFQSVSETFSIKLSLSCIIRSQVCLLKTRIKFSTKILLPAVFRWTPP